MKKRYSLNLVMENYLNEEEQDSREIESSRGRTSFTYPREVTEETSVKEITEKAVRGKEKGEVTKILDRTGDFRAEYFGKSKGKKADLVKYSYTKSSIKNSGGKTGNDHFLEGIQFTFPNGYVISIFKDSMFPKPVAYTGVSGGKLKFRGKFDTKIKREFYNQIKKQDLIDFEGAPGEKDLFNRILNSLGGIFIDSERDKAIAELEKEIGDLSESLSRGSLYRKKYFGRY